MAWFNAIIQGVGPAVNWAISNAGDIAGLLRSIKKVSALHIPRDAAEKAESPTTSGDYFKTFLTAEHFLLKEAKDKVKQKEVEQDWGEPNEGNASTTTRNLCGLWTSPSVFTSASKEVPEMYRDLVKLLAEMGVPTVITRHGEEKDVAEFVSQAIFSYKPEPPSKISQFDASNDTHFPHYAIALRDDHNSWQLFVGHVYYAIPMGRSGTDNIWHGAVHVKMIAPDYVRYRHAQEMEEFRFMEDIEPMAVDAWLVTFQIAWKAVKVARRGYQFLKEVLDDKEKKAEYKVKFNFLDGQLQTVKIQASANDKSPAEILFYLQESVADAVVRMNKGPESMSLEIAAAKGTQYQTPHVALMDSTLVTAEPSLVENVVVVTR
ncbi:uncharacterized protein LDX57_002498 [Aspergillus melleus]|uniref:uncharacterized protein n=1 Tax=Aspergillus melleus TaxID=138277 RepID=UPI001E8DDD4D|nr:uncharacterized protein LDX57_002498 [Aspergillus melleus]KAH8424755.1 hypothetical protein LDX57_002498 [Aspergillus melleus]